MRVGIGYDSHQFAKGRKLILGGVEIPHKQGLAGHSDADVVAHALTDALLGAAGLGDIGRLFPSDDPRFKDADSIQLLNQAREDLFSTAGLARLDEMQDRRHGSRLCRYSIHPMGDRGSIRSRGIGRKALEQ